jgi:hypothetical protein
MNAPLDAAPIATSVDDEWLARNQAALAAAIARLRERLVCFAADRDAPSDPESAPVSPTLARLCEAFGLSAFERDVLLLAAGRELSGEFAATLAEMNGGRAFATFGLALAALPGAHWSALSPGAPLRAWRLVEAIGDAGLTQRELRIDEPILHWLTGVAAPDERLAGLVVPAQVSTRLAPSHDALAARIARTLYGVSPPPIIEIVGADHDTRAAIAAGVAALLERPLLRIAANGPVAPHERHELAVRLKRASVLTGAAVLACGEGRELDPLLDALADAPGPIFAALGDPALPTRAGAWRFVVEAPPEEEQRAVVDVALSDTEHAPRAAALAPRVVDQLARALRAASGPLPGEAVLDACRRETRAQLEPLARRIEPRAGWDDLVVPADTRHLLRMIASQVRHRAKVYEDWGFAAKSARGLGISALFDGPSGAGKTMASEVLAGDLDVDLYHIDLASVVSKYIGETEKNLARLFDAAEGSGAILLFDEADALFGKRSEVRDSHDRYANIEVSYLLQRMESYRGLAILTTNLKSALDAAFVRRIRFIVQFPFPDAASRAEIWRRVFPVGTPLDAIDPDRLAQLNVAGGHIRNIALAAAFLAAERDEAVTMQHVLEGARLEYGKLEKPLADAETRGWAGRRRP